MDFKNWLLADVTDMISIPAPVQAPVKLNPGALPTYELPDEPVPPKTDIVIPGKRVFRQMSGSRVEPLVPGFPKPHKYPTIMPGRHGKNKIS
jgi:hypothetical protein